MHNFTSKVKIRNMHNIPTLKCSSSTSASFCCFFLFFFLSIFISSLLFYRSANPHYLLHTNIIIRPEVIVFCLTTSYSPQTRPCYYITNGYLVIVVFRNNQTSNWMDDDADENKDKSLYHVTSQYIISLSRFINYNFNG